MEEKSNCDSPDVWEKIKLAKENLLNNSQFSQQYKSPLPRDASQAPNNTHSKVVPGATSIKMKDIPETAKRLPCLKEHNPSGGVNTPTTITQGWMSSPSKGIADCSPALPTQNTRKQTNNLISSTFPSHPIFSSVVDSNIPSPTPDSSHPLRNKPPNKGMEYSPGHNLSKGLTQPRSVVAKDLASPLHSNKSPELSQPKLVQEGGIKPMLSLSPQNISLSQDKQATLFKMSESDGSDENLLRCRGRHRASNTRPMRGSEFPRGPRKHLPRQSPESFLGPSNQKEPHNRKQSEAPQGSGQENRNSHKVADIDPHSNKKKLEPKSTKAKLPDPLTQEELDWLKRMQGEIVMKAHLNHFNGLPTANPEVLTKCRDGPGADRNSAVYQEIAKTRHVSQKHLSDTKDIPTFSRMSLDGIKDGSLQEVGAAIQLCKVWYKQSPAVYPTVKNGDLLLSSKPTEEHERILAKLRMPYPKEGSQRLECHEGQSSQRPENSWTDGSPADWEFHPRSCPDYDAYHSRFQTWLQTTIDLPCYVDIYHPTFFDGTAHADGERSMFVLDMSNYNTLLEMNDEETWLHWYENAEGYCHNLTIHNKNAECEERDRRKLARKAYLDAIQSPPLQSPNSPKANIYLRPAEQKDVVELLEIHNWYAKNSTCSAYIEDLDFDSILQRIQSCCSAKLPFIVAVDCRRASTPNTERILGYALATDFGGPQPASNFTAELEIFVRPEFKEQGIGRCLLDKLVEVCDPTYSPKGGCPFKPSADERWGYYPGGRRRLGRLIFAFSYIGNKELSEYKWVKKWLERACEFEEQGLLKGVRVKFGKLLNTSYLVRNVGYQHGNNWE